MPLYLPAQGASEIEATIIEWHVAEGDRFQKGPSPGPGRQREVGLRFRGPLRRAGASAVSTWKARPCRWWSRSWRSRPTTRRCATGFRRPWPPSVPRRGRSRRPVRAAGRLGQPIVFLGFGGYLPERVVTNEELVENFPEITAEYIYQVTGIRQRRWAAEDEKPSGMAYQAALEAIRRSGIAAKDIDAVIVATTTPDVAMPSTAAILQDRLNLQTIPAFDLNAACSGWLYAVSVAQGMILSGTARNVLDRGRGHAVAAVGQVGPQRISFGDGAGAAIVSSGSKHEPNEDDRGGGGGGTTRVRAQEAGRKILDHHSQPCPGPSHYRTAPSEIPGPSDPGSPAVRSGRAVLAARRRGTRSCGLAF